MKILVEIWGVRIGVFQEMEVELEELEGTPQESGRSYYYSMFFSTEKYSRESFPTEDVDWEEDQFKI